jgi:hypothetical protein
MADSKHSPKRHQTQEQAIFDAANKAYQRDLKRILDSDRNLGIYQELNATLVVAGPQEEVDRFEVTAASRRLWRMALHPAAPRVPEPSYWRKRSPLSPRSLLTYLEPGQRKRFRRRLPVLKSVELLSRLETSEGRVRLEYRMSIADPRGILERLVSEIARAHEALAFVFVIIDKMLTSSRASLITASSVERFRLARARCRTIIRRSSRFWSGDSPISMDEATAAILSECAAHWDAFLASPPAPSNQE